MLKSSRKGGVPGYKWARLHAQVLNSVNMAANTLEALEGMAES